MEKKQLLLAVLLSQANRLGSLACKMTRPGIGDSTIVMYLLAKEGVKVFAILGYFRATVSVSTLKRAPGPLCADVTLAVRPVTPDDYTNSFSDNAFFGFISASVILKQAKTRQLGCCGAFHLCQEFGRVKVTFKLATFVWLLRPKLSTRVGISCT